MKKIIVTTISVLFIVLLILNMVPDEKRIKHLIEPLYDVANPHFVRAMGNLLGPPLIDGNRVTDFQNGDEIFPAMLEAISKAEKTVCFETYIYWSGEVG